MTKRWATSTVATLLALTGQMAVWAPGAEASIRMGGSLNVSDRSVYAGDVIKFTGRLPQRGEYDAYVLQVRKGTKWRKVEDGYTKPRGKYAVKVTLDVDDWPSKRFVFRVLGKADRYDGLKKVVTPKVSVRVSDRPGSKERPWAPGHAFELDEWTATLGVTDTDAWPERQAYYSEADPPPVGWSYIAVPMWFTRSVTGSGKPWVDLSLQFVGNDGVVYRSYATVDGYDYFCWLGDDWTDSPEVYQGATSAGTACVPVRTSAIAGGVWRISDYDTEQFVRVG